MAKNYPAVGAASAVVAACALGGASAFLLPGARDGASAPRVPEVAWSADQFAVPHAGQSAWNSAPALALGTGLAALAAGVARKAATRVKSRFDDEPRGNAYFNNIFGPVEPRWELIEKPAGPFAGGLVGTKYAGWGTYEFDPLNIAGEFPQHVPWYREAELKHGRIAMLAFVGLLVPDGFRLPLEIFQDPNLDMLTAHNKLITGLGFGPMWWLLIICGAIESLRFKQVGLGFETLSLENAGDLGFGKGFLPKTPEGIEQMKVKELKNGRLAMLAIGGALSQGIAWEAHHFPFLPIVKAM